MLGIISKKFSLGLQGTTFERVVCKCKTLKPKPWINVGVLPFSLCVFSLCFHPVCVHPVFFWPVFSACQLSLWIFEKSFPKRWESLTLTDCGKGSKDTFTILNLSQIIDTTATDAAILKKLRNIHPWGSRSWWARHKMQMLYFWRSATYSHPLFLLRVYIY